MIWYKEMYDLNDDNLEAITVEITKPKSKTFLVNTWYRPLDTLNTVFADFEECVKRMGA